MPARAHLHGRAWDNDSLGTTTAFILTVLVLAYACIVVTVRVLEGDHTVAQILAGALLGSANAWVWGLAFQP